MKLQSRSPSASHALTAEVAATAQIDCCELQYYDGSFFLLQRRPDEQGRTVLLRLGEGGVEELLPAPISSRSRVHEYGGASYLVCSLGVFFVDEFSQQIMQLLENGDLVSVTDEPAARFAVLCEHRQSGNLICVREKHTDSAVTNELVSVNISSGELKCLATGDDFYASAAVNHTGSELAFISWKHPNMPWHNNSLWRADISPEGLLSNRVEVAADVESSKGQPSWGVRGELFYLDDRSGWWNLWQQQAQGSLCVHLLPLEADLGRAQWELSNSSYQLATDSGVHAIASCRGEERLLYASSTASSWTNLEVAQVQMSSLCRTDESVAYLGAGRLSGIGAFELGRAEPVLPPAEAPLQQDRISIAESINFKTRNGSTAQGFYYPPVEALQSGDEALPPLVVVMHGGPTTACGASFKPLIQFWTSRGFAVFDINYRGSTGFGRAYRLSLGGQWGIADVQDCEDGVLHLIAKGLVDPRRVAIRGGSAGGFTALAAAVRSEVFAVAACHYGICDLELLAGDTHKFESRYLDHLIGPYPAAKNTYVERSPIHHLHAIDCPIFISHGGQDQVVPINQAMEMYRALKLRGLLVELMVFEDERHGYTKKDNIVSLLNAELDFFLRAFERGSIGC